MESKAPVSRQEMQLVSQSDTLHMVATSETPVFPSSIGDSIECQMPTAILATNFLRSGCPSVQIVFTNIPFMRFDRALEALKNCFAALGVFSFDDHEFEKTEARQVSHVITVRIIPPHMREPLPGDHDT